MDPEIQQLMDQAISQAKAKMQADFDSQKAQIRKDAQAEALAYFKSQFGL